MFKWLLFFLMIVGGILLFVTWVMGIPIPGLAGFQPPASPFNP